MKKIIFLLCLLFIPSLTLAMSPAYNIVQYTPDNIIAGSNVSLNYSFNIRTSDSVPIYFQFNISGTNTTNITEGFNLTGKFINNVYCYQNNSIINCYDNNTEIYLNAGSYNLYMFLYIIPNIKPDNYTIKFDIVSDIKQVDYQEKTITNTVYNTIYRNITQNVTQNITVEKIILIQNETIIYVNNSDENNLTDTCNITSSINDVSDENYQNNNIIIVVFAGIVILYFSIKIYNKIRNKSEVKKQMR